MVESVVINTSEENAGPTLEEQAAAMDATAPESNNSDLPSDSDGQEDRPDWLPEKFSSPEEMAKSYASLEAKMSGQDEVTEETPTTEDAVESLDLISLEDATEVKKAGDNMGDYAPVAGGNNNNYKD